MCFRSQLDNLDTSDKYQEGFRVTFDVVVSPKDRPRPDMTFPWESYTGKGVGPKILFSTKEEQQAVMQEFGK